MDAYKTDHTPRTQTHVDHGFATLSFEIPGTGDSPAAPNDPTSPDRLMSSILDWVAANAANYSFDLIRIVARGISTGGYYAMRIAHTHADRLFAVVAQGGGCHYMPARQTRPIAFNRVDNKTDVRIKVMWAHYQRANESWKRG